MEDTIYKIDCTRMRRKKEDDDATFIDYRKKDSFRFDLKILEF